MRPVIIFIVVISITCSSCFRDQYRVLQKIEVTPNENYEIKSMVGGCCGCKALLFNVSRNNQLAEQFVVETNCGLFEPTKHYFTLNAKGEVVSSKSLVAVTDDSFTVPASELDRQAFKQLDSIYQDWTAVNKRQIVFADIKGFKEGKNTHIPLGVKIATNNAK